MSDSPMEASASSRPNTSPLAACCATRLPLNPLPLAFPLSLATSPPLLSEVLGEADATLKGPAGAAPLTRVNSTLVAEPRRTWVVCGFVDPADSACPGGSVVTSRVAVYFPSAVTGALQVPSAPVVVLTLPEPPATAMATPARG